MKHLKLFFGVPSPCRGGIPPKADPPPAEGRGQIDVKILTFNLNHTGGVK